MEQITITEDDFNEFMRARASLLSSVEKFVQDKSRLIKLLEILSEEVAHMKDGKFNPKANHGKYAVYQEVVKYLKSRPVFEKVCLVKGVA